MIQWKTSTEGFMTTAWKQSKSISAPKSSKIKMKCTKPTKCHRCLYRGSLNHRMARYRYEPWSNSWRIKSSMSREGTRTWRVPSWGKRWPRSTCITPRSMPSHYSFSRNLERTWSRRVRWRRSKNNRTYYSREPKKKDSSQPSTRSPNSWIKA